MKKEKIIEQPKIKNKIKILKPNTRIYKNPDLKEKWIGLLVEGYEAEILDEIEGWVKIQYGWVKSANIEKI